MAYQNNGVAVIANNGNVTANSIFITANAREYVGVTGGTFTSDYVFGGTVSGYSVAGLDGTDTDINVIEKFPFASDTNSSDVGDLTQARRHASGQSSDVSGYTSGGYRSPPAGYTNVIDKFPFASDTNATDVGDMILATQSSSGQSSEFYGYISSGALNAGKANIQKFPFASDTNASAVGYLSVGRSDTAGQSSSTNGYVSGGRAVPTAVLTSIDKFPFAIDTDSVVSGDLSQSRYRMSGTSSATHGYSAGGMNNTPPTTIYDTIDKFAFSSDSNASDVGNLTVGRWGAGCQSSTTYGYHSGGYITTPTPPAKVNIIDKYPFSSDTNATDVGDLLGERWQQSGGNQV